MSVIACRPAVIGDAADIHALLLELAGDIPLVVDTLEQEEALYAAVRKLLGYGESWVASEGERIVAVVLVENVETGRHWGENEALVLRYAEAGAGFRDSGVLDELLAKVVGRNAPIAATVKDANRSGLASRLERLGFRPAEARLGERQLRRDP